MFPANISCEKSYEICLIIFMKKNSIIKEKCENRDKTQIMNS